jgi:hypothetical protein
VERHRPANWGLLAVCPAVGITVDYLGFDVTG